jgi:hypothetical protein
MDSTLLIMSTWLKGILLTVSAGSFTSATAIWLLRQQPYRRIRAVHSLIPYPFAAFVTTVLLPSFNRVDGPMDWEYVRGVASGLLSFPVGAVFLAADARRIHIIHSKRGFEAHRPPVPVESLDDQYP